MPNQFNPAAIQNSLFERLPQYERINDCIAGSDAIKAKGVTYLLKPDPTNNSTENAARYSEYLTRALFYNITAKTVVGLIGLAFKKPIPTLVVPSIQEYLLDNIDGAGITLEQQVKKSVAEVLALGRCALFVDYSKVKATSQQDVLQGLVRATIVQLKAENVIWVETIERGVETLLSLIIIRETYQIPTGDSYTTKTGTQYKVLRMNPHYTQEIWRQSGDTNEWQIVDGIVTPTDANGNVFDHIPFTFIGALNNDQEFDEPPLLSIADLNIAHYRNSADAEESSFTNGQPTLAITGLTEHWVKEVLKGRVNMGSRGGLPLPEGATAQLLQAKENSMPVEGMRDKEKQMAAIGARLVTDTTGDKTAREVSRDSDVEDSELSSIVGNVEQAYQFCFSQVELFTGTTDFEIELEKDFSSIKFDPTVYIALVNGTMQGVGQKEDVFNYLRDTDMIDQELDYDDWIDNMEITVPPDMGDIGEE